jgi:hypothetical protein
MESRIPVPTDNIFKFYALFGLLLLVFSCASVLYVNATSNAAIIDSVPELEALKELAAPSRADEAKIAILERKIEITKKDRDFYTKAIAGLMVVAIIAMGYGFLKWHTEIQPVLDETAKVQLEAAKLQLEKMRRELGPTPEALAVSNSAPLSASNDAGDHASDRVGKGG